MFFGEPIVRRLRSVEDEIGRDGREMGANAGGIVGKHLSEPYIRDVGALRVAFTRFGRGERSNMDDVSDSPRSDLLGQLVGVQKGWGLDAGMKAPRD